MRKDSVPCDRSCSGVGAIGVRSISSSPTSTDDTLQASGARHGVGSPPPALLGDSIKDACDNDDDNDSLGLKTGALVSGDCPSTIAVPIFRDCIESYLGTNPLDNCTGAPGSGGDAWPFDNNLDRASNIVDVLAYQGKLGLPASTPQLRRLDLNADGFVDIADVNMYQGNLTLFCA